MSEYNKSRRKFIKATAYTAPVVLSLKAAPSFACGGSPRPCMKEKHAGNFKDSRYFDKIKEKRKSLKTTHKYREKVKKEKYFSYIEKQKGVDKQRLRGFNLKDLRLYSRAKKKI